MWRDVDFIIWVLLCRFSSDFGPRWSGKAPNGLQWVETTLKHPTVTSGPILKDFCWKTANIMETSRSRKTVFLLRVVIRNAGFACSSEYQNKHALRERQPPAGFLMTNDLLEIKTCVLFANSEKFN